MDRFLKTLGRVPGWGWALVVVGTLAWTYPSPTHQITIAGIAIDTTMGIWFFGLLEIAIMLSIAALLFFALRTMLHFLEEGRWPRRIAGIEMDDLAGIGARLDGTADVLSGAADETRKLKKALEEARETIVFQRGIIERGREIEQGDEDDESRTQSQ